MENVKAFGSQRACGVLGSRRKGCSTGRWGGKEGRGLAGRAVSSDPGDLGYIW